MWIFMHLSFYLVSWNIVPKREKLPCFFIFKSSATDYHFPETRVKNKFPNLWVGISHKLICMRILCYFDRDTICRNCQQTPNLWAFSWYSLLLRLDLTPGILSILYNPASCCSSKQSKVDDGGFRVLLIRSHTDWQCKKFGYFVDCCSDFECQFNICSDNYNLSFLTFWNLTFWS